MLEVYLLMQAQYSLLRKMELTLFFLLWQWYCHFIGWTMSITWLAQILFVRLVRWGHETIGPIWQMGSRGPFLHVFNTFSSHICQVVTALLDCSVQQKWSVFWSNITICIENTNVYYNFGYTNVDNGQR